MAKTEWPKDWDVEWPSRKCREPVWNGDIAHSCDIKNEHGGPCASQSSPDSIQRRLMWIKRIDEGEDN